MNPAENSAAIRIESPPVADIVLTTLNAKYPHAAFGLRCLMANLGPLQSRAAMLEFDINQRTTDMLESILAQNPWIVGLGVYIWNVAGATQLAAELKAVRPDVILVLGGPEISYETDRQEIARHADYIVAGEADLAFADLCEKLLSGRRPLQKLIESPLPEYAGGRPGQAEEALSARPMELPYDLYTDHDLAHRVVYVEASRGCPFKCEFCLSSLDVPVRNAPLDRFLSDMQKLLGRGLRRFKFVDRTFNLNLNISKAILQFFLDRWEPGLFLHFEMIPDRLPEPLRELIARFPAGSLQFEVGIQTFNNDVSERISRRQDNARVEDNLRYLRERTGVHVHADLIVGLPGEDIASFGRGFDRLVGLGPQEIQVGMLKRLRGTPIVRHDEAWGMVYSSHAPYEVLRTSLISFEAMQKMRRFARYWDLVGNSGNFRQTLPLVFEGGSPFARFMALSEAMFVRMGRNHGIALQDLSRCVFEFLADDLRVDRERAALTLWEDYQRAGRSDRPDFLMPFVRNLPIPRRGGAGRGPHRQARHRDD